MGLMNTTLLIDAIVRQTTVLVAQLATTSGNRATLAGTANQVFMSLVTELKRQGLGNKVIADMFGLALRTYHNRIQRLTESRSFAGQSVWEAVLDYARESGPVTRAQVLARFARDEPAQVRAVLSDLVGSELLMRTGRGDSTTFRYATGADRVPGEQASDLERVAQLLWVAIHRYGPVTKASLAEIVPASEAEICAALEALVGDGRVQAASAEPTAFTAPHYLIPVGSAVGFEAAVFDHFQAMVTALCIKLRGIKLKDQKDDWVGGSTYCYDVWPSHPLHDEVAGFLRAVRQQAVALRQRVDQHNATSPRPTQQPQRRFTTYVGQGLISDEPEAD